MSSTAAPFAAVITPMHLGKDGISFLYFMSKRPSSSNFLFNYSNASCSEPLPFSSTWLIFKE